MVQFSDMENHYNILFLLFIAFAILLNTPIQKQQINTVATNNFNVRQYLNN